MAKGTLIEFGGLPATGKSTLAKHVAAKLGAVFLRVDEIESAMRRNQLPAEQTGIAAYSVAHAIAVGHLQRGLTVVADAVNPVAEARAGWEELAATAGARLVIIEAVCPDLTEHRRRVESRDNDVPGWTYPDWSQVLDRASEYQPREDRRLVVDTTRPLDVCRREVMAYVSGHPTENPCEILH